MPRMIAVALLHLETQLGTGIVPDDDTLTSLYEEILAGFEDPATEPRLIADAIKITFVRPGDLLRPFREAMSNTIGNLPPATQERVGEELSADREKLFDVVAAAIRWNWHRHICAGAIRAMTARTAETHFAIDRLRAAIFQTDSHAAYDCVDPMLDLIAAITKGLAEAALFLPMIERTTPASTLDGWLERSRLDVTELLLVLMMVRGVAKTWNDRLEAMVSEDGRQSTAELYSSLLQADNEGGV